MEIPRLHPDTIEQVKQRSDIVDVISEQVVLKKRGKDYVGLCPFHEEKTPSFSVSPSNQMYHCFGCEAGGDAIKFLMELGKRSFPEVVLDLARRYQVPVQTLEPEQRQELQRQLSEREQLYEILAEAMEFYKHALRQPQGQVALEYLKSDRRLSESTIQQFQLGYAPAGWETLYKYLTETLRRSVKLVEKAGLIVPRKSGGGYIDRFRDRLMIPIHDISGRVIGFGGRTLSEEQPKYLNSPETELFDKSKTLFALDFARDAIRKQDRAVVVEGYFDAIALHAAGIPNVVASLGTALSLDQVRLLLRYTESNQIVLNFDADAAGIAATERAIGDLATLAYKGEVPLRILNIPDGKDADEFLKSRPDAVEQYRHLLTQAPLWLDWQIQQILVNLDLQQPDQFQKVAQKMVNLMSKIENPQTRLYYIQHCAQILSRGDAQLVPRMAENFQRELKKPIPKSTSNNQPTPDFSVPTQDNLLEQAEALLLLIYLHCPEYRQAIVDTLSERDLTFSLSHHRFLWQQILEIEALWKSDAQPSQLISLLQERIIEFPSHSAKVTRLWYLDEKTQQEILHTPLVIQTAATSMERAMCQKQSNYCVEQLQKFNFSTSPERWQFYQKEFYHIEQRIRKLDQLRLMNFSEFIHLS